LVYCTSFQVSNSKNVGGRWKFRFQNPVTWLESVYFCGKTHEIKGGLFYLPSVDNNSTIISYSYPDYATHQNLHAISRSSQFATTLFRPCRSGENHDRSFVISRSAGTGLQGKTEHGLIRLPAPEESGGIETHNRST
jgi:hypothetical protein